MKELWSRLGLPAKLLVLTLFFVMLAEVLIFVPSIANFRVKWLTERLSAARLAAIAADAVPEGNVPPAIRRELLASAGVLSVAIKRNDLRRLVLPPEMPLSIDATYAIHMPTGDGAFAFVVSRWQLINEAIAVFLRHQDRTILVFGHPETSSGLAIENLSGPREFVEVAMSEAPLRAVMMTYALNILGLSIIISMIAAALVYFALNRALVQPMMRLTNSMVHFSKNPEDAGRIIVPSSRRDEIGIAERELAGMQTQLSQLLHQKSRLAQLGLAVSKINHDLRNMLASVHLLSDRLSSVTDPTVQRFAPKLIASIDRAINFCNDTLRFGQAEEAAPRREVFAVSALLTEVADGLGLPNEGIGWTAEISPGVVIDADREHLYRVLNNVCRNSVQVMELAGSKAARIVVTAERAGRLTRIVIADNGPGVAPKARANLFKAFQGGARKGGTGLGLAIASELVMAHGGRIHLVDGTQGAVFRIEIPDRMSSLPDDDASTVEANPAAHPSSPSHGVPAGRAPANQHTGADGGAAKPRT